MGSATTITVATTHPTTQTPNGGVDGDNTNNHDNPTNNHDDYTTNTVTTDITN